MNAENRTAATGRRYSRVSVWGLVCVLASLVLAVVLLPPLMWWEQARQEEGIEEAIDMSMKEFGPTETAPGAEVVKTSERYRYAEVCYLAVVLPLALAGTAMGWVAFGRIRGSKGALRGKGMALCVGLFYPVTAAVGVPGFLVGMHMLKRIVSGH